MIVNLFVTCHMSLVTGHLSIVICPWSFVIGRLAIGDE
jgi:hypothetical protein